MGVLRLSGVPKVAAQREKLRWHEAEVRSMAEEARRSLAPEEGRSSAAAVGRAVVLKVQERNGLMADLPMGEGCMEMLSWARHHPSVVAEAALTQE